MEMQIVYNMRCAGYLMQKGFVLMDMKPDKTSNSGKNVFFFKKTEALTNAMNEYFKNR